MEHIELVQAAEEHVQPAQPNAKVPNPAQPELAQDDENPETKRHLEEMSRSMLKWFAKDEGKGKCDDEYKLLLRFLLQEPGIKLVRSLTHELLKALSEQLLNQMTCIKTEDNGTVVPDQHLTCAIDLIEELTGETGKNVLPDQKLDLFKQLTTPVGLSFLKGFKEAICDEKNILPRLFSMILESVNGGAVQSQHQTLPYPGNQLAAIVKVFAKTQFGSSVFSKLFLLPPSPGMIDIMKAIKSRNTKAIDLFNSMATLMCAHECENCSHQDMIELVSTISCKVGIELILSLYQPSILENWTGNVRDRYSSILSVVPDNTTEENWPCKPIPRTSFTSKLSELDISDSNECPLLSHISINSSLKTHLIEIEHFENLTLQMINIQLQDVLHKSSSIERELVTVLLYSVKDMVVAQTCFLKESYCKIFEYLIWELESFNAIVRGELKADHPLPDLQLGVHIWYQYRVMTEENSKKLEDMTRPEKKYNMHLKEKPLWFLASFRSCSTLELQLVLEEFQMLTYSIMGGWFFFESDIGWNRLDNLALHSAFADVEGSDLNAPDELTRNRIGDELATSQRLEKFQERFLNGKLFDHIPRSQREHWFVLLYLKMTGKTPQGPDNTS